MKVRVENERCECDFCSAPNPVVCYPTREFEVRPGKIAGVEMEVTVASGWRACETCRRLVDTGDDIRLLLRSVETFEARFQIQLPPNVVEDMRARHDDFRKSRAGLPVSALN